MTPTIDYSTLTSTKLSLHADDPCSESKTGRAFLDASGRAKTHIKVQLLDVLPENSEMNDETMTQLKRMVSLEMKVSKSSLSVAIEGVRVLNYEKMESSTGSVILNAEVVLRVNSDMVGRLFLKNKQRSGIVSISLELCSIFCVLRQKKLDDGQGIHHAATSLNETVNSLKSLSFNDVNTVIFSSSKVLDQSKTTDNCESIRTNLVFLNMELMEAFNLSCSSMPAAHSAYGATLISVTISHSNTHSEPIVVSGISLHPGHSRPVVVREINESSETKTAEQMIEYTRSTMSYGIESDNRCMQGGNGVLDMSRHVRWCFVAGTVLDLPLIIYPHEAYSTVLQVDASDNSNPRLFMSPVAVTASLSSKTFKPTIVIFTYASWTTSRAAVSPVDAFRVDMSLYENKFKVGEPFTVSLGVCMAIY